MSEIKYKLAGLEDYDVIMKAGDALFDYVPKENRTLEFLKDDRHQMIIALLGNSVIGMASAFSYVHPDKDTSLFVNEVAVLKEYQSQGIGRTLVKELVAYGKKNNYAEIWVATETSNIAAKKAYIAAGAKIDPEPVTLFTFET